MTKKFWDITSGDDRKFVADPSKGSVHNRGCAVDLTLFKLSDGEELEMPTPFDEFSDRYVLIISVCWSLVFRRLFLYAVHVCANID